MLGLTAKRYDEEKKAEIEPALLDKVYSHLKERKMASPPQIARDLNLKVSTVMEVLRELKRLDKVKLIRE